MPAKCEHDPFRSSAHLKLRAAVAGRKSIGQIARELDLTVIAVRDRIARADIDANADPTGR